MSTIAVTTWLSSVPLIAGLGLIAWAVSSARRNAGLVDIFWSLFFLAAAIFYAVEGANFNVRALLVLALVTAWSLRLSIHLARRNWNSPEDHRYQAIRLRNEPGFTWKSLYLVFGLQVVLAWLISAPLAVALSTPTPIGPLDVAGATLAVFGIGFEAIADAQLVRFLARPGTAGGVLDQGLWRYSRHPNYFGECCVWWGLYVIALAAGGWWTVFSPLLMTALLLRVSGVTLLEKDIGERRPAYLNYITHTNAFFPGPRRGA